VAYVQIYRSIQLASSFILGDVITEYSSQYSLFHGLLAVERVERRTRTNSQLSCVQTKIDTVLQWHLGSLLHEHFCAILHYPCLYLSSSVLASKLPAFLLASEPRFSKATAGFDEEVTKQHLLLHIAFLMTRRKCVVPKVDGLP
jgi:hypothetical protein